jgi:hypothetical protein
MKTTSISAPTAIATSASDSSLVQLRSTATSADLHEAWRRHRHSHGFFGAALPFLISLISMIASLPLARRLSIKFAGNVEERVSGVLSIRVESKEVTPIALTRELLAA